jgi:enoyl-CoA hydratase/3-hydroxyacyl-CoA dehydrogenase
MPKRTPVAVVGAGNMGSGIAQKLAQEGFKVVMNDMTPEFVEKGMDRIRTLLGEAVERRIFTQEQVDEIIGRITPTAELADLAECGVVIEAIFEDEAVKKELFSKLDKVVAPTAILATNTSSFYVTNIAESIQNPERVVGLHFFYHPAKNRLVEVIPGAKTSDEVVDRCLALSFAMGKTPIVCKDRPGFVVNRFFVPWLNESVRLLENNVADIPTIEAAAKKAFSIGMGPFELMNVTGVPIAMHAEATLGRELGSYYEPCAKLIEQGSANQLWSLEGDPDESKFDAVAAHLRGVVFQVAGEILDEDICRLEDVDRGAKIGLRWIRGPFELMNKLGVDQAIAEAKGFCAASGHTLSPTLAAQAARGGDFELRWVDLEVREGVGTITINRPEAMNSLNEAVMQDLAEVFVTAAKDPAVKGIVIEGAGKAFVAGADIGFFIKQIKGDDLARIESFTRAGAAILRKIETCAKPVIALADGLTLGGGSELALACHAIVATEKSRFAFPETSIGIYPGLGGTQRLPRIVGRELARYMILSNAPMSGKDAHEIGMAGYYCASDEARDLARKLALSGEVTDKYAAKPTPEGWETVVEAFSGTEAAPYASEDKRIARAAKSIERAAPIALSMCNEFIDKGLPLEIDEGLELELSNLQKIFATADSLEGLTSLGKRRPEFKGE